MENESKPLKAFICCFDDDKAYEEKLQALLGEENVVLGSKFKDADTKDSLAFMKSLREGDLKDTAVTIVLIGENTWKRKLIDLEVLASMQDDAAKKRNGIIGLILPSRIDYQKGHFYRYTIPQRLYDNYPNGYVKIYNWKEDAGFIKRIMAKSVERKDMLVPNLTRTPCTKNKAPSAKKWDK